METRLRKKIDHCCICYEKASKQGKINCCQHVFCYQCISNWSKIQNTCPMCKQRFTKISQKPFKKSYNKTKKVIQKQQNIEQRNQGETGPEISFTLQQFTEGLLQIIHIDFQLFSTFLSIEGLDEINLHF